MLAPKTPPKRLAQSTFFWIFFPRHVQDAPKMPQDASKMPPRHLQGASKNPQDASKTPLDRPSKLPQIALKHPKSATKLKDLKDLKDL